jgi:ADP-ribose pyrophosphatase
LSYEVLSSRVAYKGKIMTVCDDEVVMPNGNVTHRETVVRGNAVAIVPVDDDGNIYFVRQYRHAAKKMMLEIPAGMIEKGEEPEKAALRELEEEIGFKAGSLKFINDTYMAIGMCTEKVYLYIAENLTEGVLNPDEDEFIEIEKYPLEKCLKMIFDREIEDVKTMAGILAYAQMKDKM